VDSDSDVAENKIPLVTFGVFKPGVSAGSD